MSGSGKHGPPGNESGLLLVVQGPSVDGNLGCIAGCLTLTRRLCGRVDGAADARQGAPAGERGAPVGGLACGTSSPGYPGSSRRFLACRSARTQVARHLLLLALSPAVLRLVDNRLWTGLFHRPSV